MRDARTEARRSYVSRRIRRGRGPSALWLAIVASFVLLLAIPGTSLADSAPNFNGSWQGENYVQYLNVTSGTSSSISGTATYTPSNGPTCTYGTVSGSYVNGSGSITIDITDPSCFPLEGGTYSIGNLQVANGYAVQFDIDGGPADNPNLNHYVDTFYNADAPTALDVDSTSDAPNTNPAAPICSDAQGECTLRGAIQAANILGGSQTIDFDIPGDGVPVVSPATPLPAITAQVTIDGTSQPGGGAVRIDGGGAVVGNGLTVRASHSTLEGVSVSGFQGAGLALQGTGGVQVTRGAFSDNGGDGIQVGDSSNATLGGSLPSDAITVTGNKGAGVEVKSGRGIAIGQTTMIYGNGGLPIDLGLQGAVNHPGGTLAGAPNDALSAPVIWHVLHTLSLEGVQGIVPNAPPGASLRLDFESNACAPRTAGPATVVSEVVTTDKDGTARFQEFGLPGGQSVDVRATLLTGDAPVETSETSTCAVDLDGDTIPDEWETGPISPYRDGHKDLNLAAMGASPRHKDLFLQVDWAPGQEIDPEAAAMIEQAFARAPVANLDGRPGIALHIDDGPDSVMDPRSGKKWGDLSEGRSAPAGPDGLTDGQDWSKVDALQAKLMPIYRIPVFRFAFSNLAAVPHDPSTLGISHGIPGSELVLGLRAGCTTGVCPVSLIQQAGGLMHEFGHLLGLQHGGLDSVNFKPNELSVMNYAFTETGLVTVKDGTAEPGLLDYSRFGEKDLPILDESALNEATGLTPTNSVLRHYVTLWQCPNGKFRDGVIGTPFDWNCDDRIERQPVAADLTGGISGSTKKPTLGVLTPYDEWNDVTFVGGDMLDPAPVVASAADVAAGPSSVEQWPSTQTLLSMARTLTGDHQPPSVAMTARAGRRGRQRVLIITVRAHDNGELDSVAVRIDRGTQIVLRNAKLGSSLVRKLTLPIARGRHVVLAEAIDEIGQVSPLRRAVLIVP